jgi:hypothetical protein
VLLEDGEVGVGAIILNDNTLDGAGIGAIDFSLSTAVALRVNVGTNATFGKVRNNILLGGPNKSRYGVYEDPPLLDATWHLAATSPVIDKGTSTEAPSRDIDDESRPKGTAVDIGADEAK